MYYMPCLNGKGSFINPVTATTTQPDFTTSFNTEFRDLQAENSNLKAEVEELKQKFSNLEIDVQSLQRVVFRGV
jgi:predicted RNase H-like nuclease (RuvC/YqgF family)